MNAVFGSILENLKAIEIVDDSTVEVFRSDRTFTGDSKEVTVQQFIHIGFNTPSACCGENLLCCKTFAHLLMNIFSFLFS